MKLVYTEQALISLEETLEFLAKNVTNEKLMAISDRISEKVKVLLNQPFIGQEEPLLQYLGSGHRRLLVGHCKIIYKVVDEYIYITDIFDSRQDPDKMKG